MLTRLATAPTDTENWGTDTKKRVKELKSLRVEVMEKNMTR
jgi:hypothetical protein